MLKLIMDDDDKPPHLKVIDAERIRAEEKRFRQSAYLRRATSQKDFYAEARMNIERLKLLREALLVSIVADDDGEAVIKWSPKLIQDMLDSVEDPGPIRNKRKIR